MFVDNWDTERNGSTLSYKDGANYTLANVFMLAWPYGSPDVHSGYEFTDNDAGPPNGGTVNACYADGWKCQHRWPEIQSMVGFHNTARGQSVTDWWDNGANQIAFGRGAKAYVAINHESTALTRTFQTSLPAGDYCDVQSGKGVTVNSAGQLHRHPRRQHRARPPGQRPYLRRFGRVRPPPPGPPSPSTPPPSSARTSTSPATRARSATGTRPRPQARPRELPGVEARRRAARRHVVRVQVPPQGRRRQVTWESGANRTATVPPTGRSRSTTPGAT